MHLFQSYLIAVSFALYSIQCTHAANLTPLEAEQDIGKVRHVGSTAFDPVSKSFLISGGGENMWFTNDAFHFVWKRMSGNFRLRAAVDWLTTDGNPHRKACLLIRQSLEPDAPYVDVAIHGNGLTSLQYRLTPGGQTREIQIGDKAPGLAGMERQSDVVFALAPSHDGSLEPSGASIRLRFNDPVFVGLGVCSHDDNSLVKARFSNVLIEPKQRNSDARAVVHCSLETVAISSKDRKLIYHTLDHIEAPNWSRDGQFLLFNGKGRLFRLPLSGGKPEPLDTGFAIRCNNDHGFSPDGMQLAISDQTKGGKSLIYILPAAGGTPRQITSLAPSYWHGWSPDGQVLAFCGERNGEFDVYSIAASGGDEKRLTTAKGLDDGPDFTPDGKFIYFNSERSGSMHVWRMRADGSEQEQITFDEFNNWFPHPSPDGKWIVFLSYDKW